MTCRFKIRKNSRIIHILKFVKIRFCASLLSLKPKTSVLHTITVFGFHSYLSQYGHVLRKDDNDWVKKCMEYEVEGPRPRGRPKRTWREVVREDCQARKLNKEDAMDRCKWRKLIKDV